MTFLLPAEMDADALRELERSCATGGADNMPVPTEVRVGPGYFHLRPARAESSYIQIPWLVQPLGCLMGNTATLTVRDKPYLTQLELARGKVNQLRCQAAEWQTSGLELDSELRAEIAAAGTTFCQAIGQSAIRAGSVNDGSGLPLATDALERAYRAADQLVHTYIQKVFQTRRQWQPQLNTTLSCRVFRKPEARADLLGRACNSICMPLPWKEVEPDREQYYWKPSDEVLAWAESRQSQVSAGPLIDFSVSQLPKWLKDWQHKLTSLADFMCRYVETAVRQYRGRIQRWQLTAATNCVQAFDLNEDDLFWLIIKLLQAARQVEPGLELSIGIRQPWGEYLKTQERQSPFMFADTFVRAGLEFSTLDLEIVMGVTPGGSYCRDLLETSRLLDLYAVMGVPLRIVLGYPSASGSDPLADPEMKVGGGFWRNGYTPETQADWATAFASLALCKPYVSGIQWTHAADADPHQFPHCGLIDAAGNAKPALERLAELRQRYLK